MLMSPVRLTTLANSRQGILLAESPVAECFQQLRFGPPFASLPESKES